MMNFIRYKYRGQHLILLLLFIGWGYIASERHYPFFIFVVGMLVLDLILTFRPRFGGEKD